MPNIYEADGLIHLELSAAENNSKIAIPVGGVYYEKKIDDTDSEYRFLNKYTGKPLCQFHNRSTWKDDAGDGFADDAAFDRHIFRSIL